RRFDRRSHRRGALRVFAQRAAGERCGACRLRRVAAQAGRPGLRAAGGVAHRRHHAHRRGDHQLSAPGAGRRHLARVALHLADPHLLVVAGLVRRWHRHPGVRDRSLHSSRFGGLVRVSHRERLDGAQRRQADVQLSGRMEFGVFDHLDKNDRALARYYRERLEVIEAYERAGFYAYHVAEHHLTDLGMAPSPSVFLAAVAQRTKRLRLGPMIYAAPLYHPLRLLQEICMLDQMSAGRLEMGFGRGAAAAEIRFFDVDPAQTEKMYEQVVGFILEGLREGAVTVSAEGGRKRRMPLAIPPFQKPHPPLWYGIHSPQAAERVARRGMNVLGLDTVGELAPSFRRFRAVWKETRGEAPLPKIGIGRFVFVARSAGEALSTARRAYRRWHQ